MSLLDDLENQNLLYNKFGQRCGMCRIVEELGEKEAEKIGELLANPAISKAQLAKVLAKNGYQIKPGVLSRHARGECAG